MLVTQAALVNPRGRADSTIRGPNLVASEKIENEFQVDHTHLGA